MTARLTVIFSILAFAVINIAGLIKGKDVTDVWLSSLAGLVGFAFVGFLLGSLYDRLIKETMIHEDALMFNRYLEDNPEAGGENSKVKDLSEEQESEESEDEVDGQVS